MPLSSPAQTFADDSLTALNAQRIQDLPYSGDVSPRDAYAFMQQNPALLVDVRTAPEWQFTGVPDMSATKAPLATISWKMYPQFITNPNFADQLAAQGATHDTVVFFLCRSGGRSLDAALAMAALGYRHCYNVSGGFEGECDASGHRGTEQGWKAAALPWKQG